MFHYKSSGLDIRLVNGFETIEIDGQESTAIHDMDGLHLAITQCLVDLSRPLTGKEFRFLRVELDMSQKALGAIMDKTDQSVAKWEKENRVPREADLIVRTLCKEKLLNQEPHLSSMIEELNEADRSLQEQSMLFEETENQWRCKQAA